MTKKASIILLTKNSRKTLNDVLKGIFLQKASFDFEVLIIDSSSEDNSVEIAIKYPVKLEIIQPESFNHGETRNLGASLTTGDFIVFLSHDAVPTENWLEPLVDIVENSKDIAGAYSRQIPALKTPLTIKRVINEEWCFGSEKGFINRYPDFSQDPSDIYRTFFFTNVSSCIKREVWEKIPFRKCEIGEDILWASDVLKAGYATVYQPESEVIHAHVRKISKHYKDNLIHARTMKKFILLNDIFGLDSVSKDKRSIDRLKKRLSNPLNLNKMIYILLTQICKDFQYIIKQKEIRTGKKLWNIIFSVLWQSALAIGNYLGYRSKLEKK